MLYAMSFGWPHHFKMMAAALTEANLRQIYLFQTPLGNSIPLLTHWIGERRYKNSLTQHSLSPCHVAATWPHSPCCGFREEETAGHSHWAQICQDWREYSGGPQNSGENSPVLWSGVSGQRGPGRKEMGTEGITPYPSLSSFPCSPHTPLFSSLAAMWKRAWFFRVDLGKRGS